MSSTFGTQSTQSQTPTFAGTTTREQGAQPTGASATAGSAAPVTNTAAKSQAPSWTNLQNYLSANQNEAGGVADAVTASTNSAAAAATSTGSQALGNTQSAASAGTNTGSLSSTVTSVPKPTGRSLVAANSSPSGILQAAKNETQLSGRSASTASTASTSPSSVSAPTYAYDGSTLNLAGYTGPDASTAASSFTGPQAAAQSAQQQAQALASGSPTSNIYDNALVDQTPAWSKLQSAINGAGNAANAVNSQQQQAGQAVQNAQNTVNASDAAQHQQIAAAQASLSAASGANQAATASLASQFGAGQYTQAAENTGALEAYGVPANVATTLSSEAASGQLSGAQIQAALQPYINAASSYTGYNQNTANQWNSIQSALGTGPTASASTLPSQDSLTAAQRQAQQNGQAAYGIGQQATKDVAANKTGADATSWTNKVIGGGADSNAFNGNLAENATAKGQVAQLTSAGYSPQQIQQMTGLTPDEYALLTAAPSSDT